MLVVKEAVMDWFKTTHKTVLSGIALLLALALSSVALADAGSSPIAAKIKWHLKDNSQQWAYSSTLKSLYKDRDYRPIWLDDNGLNRKGETLLENLRTASLDGLVPDDYHYSEIIDLLEQNETPYPEMDLVLSSAYIDYGSDLYLGRLDPTRVDKGWHIAKPKPNMPVILETALRQSDLDAALRSLSPPTPEYRKLRKVMVRLQAIAENGGWPGVAYPVQLKPGWSNEQVPQIRQTLKIMGDLDSDSEPDVAERYDDEMREAVVRFQKRHGLRADGIIGTKTIAALNIPVVERIRQVQVNMERWRWMPREMEDRYVLINIPEFKLRLFDHGEVTAKHSVIVGKAYKESPVLKSAIRRLVLNPYWNVPAKIAREELLGDIQKNPSFLTSNNIEIIGAKGKTVSPGSVNWSQYSANNFPFRLRQRPGAKNALGKIKFIFPNKYDVYLHDTPSRYLFDYDTRTFSHGCIRAENPELLASELLQDNSGGARIRDMINQGETRTVPLPNPVPIYVTYFSAWVDEDGTPYFYSDIYDRDRNLARYFPKFRYRDGTGTVASSIGD